MSKRRKRRTDGGFVMVTRQLTSSAAYRSLSARAGWLLHRLMDEFNGEDNRVSLSRREAETWLKSGPHKAAMAFDELEAKGFIRLHERGGFTRKVRHATIWTLTMYGCHGAKATLDFLSWQGQPLVTDRQSRKPKKTNHGYRRATNTGIDAPPRVGPIGTDAPPASPTHGYRRATNIGTDAPPLSRSTIQSTPKRKRRASADSWPAQIRRAANLSQAELGARVGLSRGYIASIEQGLRKKPTPEIVRKIERACLTPRWAKPTMREIEP